jgi:hypothetical protein
LADSGLVKPVIDISRIEPGIILLPSVSPSIGEQHNAADFRDLLEDQELDHGGLSRAERCAN